MRHMAHLGVRGFYQDHTVRAEFPLYGLQGRFRPLRSGLPPHLWFAYAYHQLLKQLRALPIPREVDTTHGPARSDGEVTTGI